MPTYIIFYALKDRQGLIEGFTTDKALWKKILAKCKKDDAYQFQTCNEPNFKGDLDFASPRSIKHQSQFAKTVNHNWTGKICRYWYV